MLPAHRLERLQQEGEAVIRAHALAHLDKARGRHGAGRSLHAMLTSHHTGGALPMFHGQGDTPTYGAIEHHVGNGIVMGGDFPMFHGQGFMSFLKKVGSLGSKALSKVKDHAMRAATENRGALMDIGKAAANKVLHGDGSVTDRLRGGISSAAADVGSLARSQAADRLKALIT